MVSLFSRHTPDAAGQKAAPGRLNERFKQQKLISEVSVGFSSNEFFAESVENSLEKIAKFFEADRIYIFTSSKDKNDYSCYYEWNGGVPSAYDDNESILSLFDGITLKKFVCAKPGEARGPGGIKSAMGASLVINGTPRGFLGVDVCRSSKTWGESEQRLFESLARLFAIAYENEIVKAKLRKAMEAAENAGKAKTVFLSAMGREIRAPLNAISGMVKIAENASDPEKIRYCLDTIEASSKHLLALINGIPDMSGAGLV